MKRQLPLAALAVVAALGLPVAAQAGSEYDALIAQHAQANNVPEALVHRVIIHESRYQPQLVGRGGAIGLMQIKLATARSLGYTGDAAGLRDPNTNLTYAVKYLAGAYRAANGDHARAMHYYAAGYYDVAKQQRLAYASGRVLDSSGTPQPPLEPVAPRHHAGRRAIDARAQARLQAPLQLIDLKRR
ncbi:MAG TPA: transglycosylase SLT domain-containing protein [Bradyrhizobium sp.]|jgi:soluble lytic murein transglycosylase-like protein|nr:transglycosylase SLT domain-containing protein [Bradyrhizobium sp.]